MSSSSARATGVSRRSDTQWPTVGHYLLEQLAAAGIGHVFGVPGDYVLRLYDVLDHSPLVHVGTTREDTAAFAADGYARCRGLGALAVTYGVGALNTVNAIAGADAESSPVVVISGAPGVEEQRKDQLLHHRFGPFGLQREIFERSEFLASAFYTTMGFAVPAALGAKFARPQLRPLVLVGDGAFQMTGTELATAARLGLDPIVIVFNNRGYSTERFILDGPFNDIGRWHFHRLGELFDRLLGLRADDEESFDEALRTARGYRQGPTVIDVALRPDDASPAMRRLATHLSRRIGG